jgi:hypothetical protein
VRRWNTLPAQRGVQSGDDTVIYFFSTEVLHVLKAGGSSVDHVCFRLGGAARGSLRTDCRQKVIAVKKVQMPFCSATIWHQLLLQLASCGFGDELGIHRSLSRTMIKLKVHGTSTSTDTYTGFYYWIQGEIQVGHWALLELRKGMSAMIECPCGELLNEVGDCVWHERRI